MPCNHKLKKIGKRIIPDKNCPTCQANVRFLKAILNPNKTVESEAAAYKEYQQED